MADSSNRILIVDDDVDVRTRLGDALTDAGYGVDVAGDGKEGLELLKSIPTISLVLLDLKMPVMDGWQFCREKLQEDGLKKIPVVVLSGAGDLESSPDALHAQALLPKPLDVDRVLDTVRGAVGVSSAAARL